MRFEDTLVPARDHPTCHIFGYDDVTPLCISEGHGHIVHLSPTRAIERHVNGSIELFADFLVIYEKCRREVVGLDDRSVDELIDRVEAQMGSADPSAVEEPEFYWSVILEQMRDGLL